MCLLWVSTVIKQLVWQFGTFQRSTASPTFAKPRDGSQRFEPSWAGRPFFAKPSESYVGQYEPYPSLATDSSSNGLFAFDASPFYARNARKLLEIIKLFLGAFWYFVDKWFRSELASGWDFFGIPNPDPGDVGFKLPISDQSQLKRHFVINENFKYILKILGFYGFLAIGVFRDFFENPRDFRQIPGFRDFFFWVLEFLSPDFLSPGFGIFLNFGIFISGFSRNPRDSGFFGIFHLRDIPRIFYPRDRDFFQLWWRLWIKNSNMSKKRALLLAFISRFSRISGSS